MSKRIGMWLVAVTSIVGVLGTRSAVAANAAGGHTGAFPALVTTGLDRGVLNAALAASSCVHATTPIAHPELLTIIDYSKPSTAPRLWVLDTARQRVLFTELVAHGRGSGDNLARHFSNDDGSLQSSLGLFLTADTYVGTNGYSLRLRGLEPGFNDRALARAIVMHGAAYVRPGMEQFGRLGRSWGCPALSLASARQVIDAIKEGSLVFAYYPDPQWLQQSRFLGGCSATPKAAVAN
jgi:hypothetical protein